ncbi:endocardial cushion cell development [Sparganum proliferum]
MVRQLHDDMTARVTDNGAVSAAFTVTNGVKQDCVLAPTLFSLMFSAMLLDAYRDERPGIRIAYWTDGHLLNQRRMHFKPHASTTAVHELLFADVCALNTTSEGNMQRSIDLFAVCENFGLIICTEKTRTFRTPIGLVGHLRTNCHTRTAPTFVSPSTSPSPPTPSTNSDRPPEPPLPSFSSSSSSISSTSAVVASAMHINITHRPDTLTKIPSTVDINGEDLALETAPLLTSPPQTSHSPPLAIHPLASGLLEQPGNCCQSFALMVSSAMASPSPLLATLGIKLSYFENNLNFRLRSECCALSRPEICAEQCDLQFRFCFEDYQVEVSSTDSSVWSGQCQYGAANITFGRTLSQPSSSEDIITRVELTNPWPGAFTLILEAYQIKPQGGALSMIDQTVYRHILLPTTSKAWRPLVISSPSSTYELAIQFQCSPNHYGRDCSRVCEPVKDRFSCDPQGRKVCAAGWSGQDCDKPICRKGCHDIHGSCKTPGECKCSRGWTGENCDECVKYPGCQKGVCDDAPFTCRCLPNWGGPFCDQDLDYCRRHKPCLHGGICQNTNATHSQFRCVCPRGYRGERCEEKLDACALNPCKRGKCIPNNTHGFRCVCSAGWRGKYCEENIDFCDQNRCMNGGTCQDLDGEGFHCECPPGFEGSVCQRRSACSESRCVHARECTRMATTSNGIKHDCVCQAGWTGELCDHNIDDCTDKCKNGGQCRDLVGDYVCVCPEGFSGRNCEINHKCDVNPCKNDGVCVETDGGFKCICPEGVTGELCEVAKRGCDPNPCLNNAYCYDIEPNDYYCKCDANFYGRHCEHVRPYCGPLGCTRLLDPCSREHELAAALIADLSSGSANASVLPTPVLPVTLNAQEVVIPKSVCGVHGICAKNDDGYGCVCETGYAGKYCEEVKDSCLDAPCLNGATCLNAGGEFQCLCREGFTGQFCEFESHPCDEEPCYNGGYCQRTGIGTDFQCRCAPGWSGMWCHLPGTDPCAVSQPCRNNGICVTDAHSPTGYYCKCPFGWTGSTCQRRDSELQACANNSICENGGTCVDINEDAHCFCRPGFDGAHCEVNIDECRSNPCLNGGICHDLVNGFRCECQNGFMGPDCGYNIDDCATHPCAYGATCVDKIGGYECVCPEGRRGKHCEEVSSPSVPKPPSCRFNHRIYDHGQQWNYDCHRCECVKGKIVCEQVRWSSSC